MLKESDIVIDIRNLVISKHKNQSKPIVNSISFSLKKSKITALIGKSGSGKSLTAQSIIGLKEYMNGLEIDGEILFNKNGKFVDILKLNSKEIEGIRGAQISMVFQNPYSSFDPINSIGEQLVEVLKLYSKYEDPRATAIGLLSKFGVDSSKFDSFPHELSGGQLQRVGIAIAIANRPKVLIADEPTTNLDASLKREFLDLLLKIKVEFDLAVLYISHDLDAVKYIADEVALINEGEIVEIAKKNQFFSNPKKMISREILDSYYGDQVRKDIFKYNKKDFILEVDDIQKAFRKNSFFYLFDKDRVEVLKNISFKLNKNEVLGIVGESGSGKTTLAKIILRLLEADSGKVFFLSNNVFEFEKRELKKMRTDMQVVLQNPVNSLNPAMSIKSLIKEAVVLSGESDEIEIERRIYHFIDLFGLDIDILKRNSRQISGGEGQRIAIARIIALKPKLIILDESISSLDKIAQKEVLNLLNDMKNRFDLSYLFITHDLRVSREFCDRILVMKEGEIVDSGSANYIFNKSNNVYTRKLVMSSKLNM